MRRSLSRSMLGTGLARVRGMGRGRTVRRLRMRRMSCRSGRTSTIECTLMGWRDPTLPPSRQLCTLPTHWSSRGQPLSSATTRQSRRVACQLTSAPGSAQKGVCTTLPLRQHQARRTGSRTCTRRTSGTSRQRCSRRGCRSCRSGQAASRARPVEGRTLAVGSSTRATTSLKGSTTHVGRAVAVLESPRLNGKERGRTRGIRGSRRGSTLSRGSHSSSSRRNRLRRLRCMAGRRRGMARRCRRRRDRGGGEERCLLVSCLFVR